MKTLILTILLTLSFGLFTASEVSAETFTLHVGHQKTTAHGKITIKVVEVLEDSRCPPDAMCVWAGNVKIKLTLAKGKKAAKSFELNSTLDPKLILFEGYDIRFVDLRPRRGEIVKPSASSATVILSVTKHVK